MSAFAALTLSVFGFTGCSTTDSDKTAADKTEEKKPALERFSFEQPQMGVPFRIVLYAPSEAAAEAAAKAAFARVAALNEVMSDYETDSELSKLSRSSEEGSPEVPVSPELWTVLSRAQQLASETDGAFDVTVGPVVSLWRNARRSNRYPEAARLQTARDKVGYQYLHLDKKARTARLTKFGMRLDLGAIAKGYAADEALKALASNNIKSALVAASGDLALGDPPPGEKGWKIEITGYDHPIATNSVPSGRVLLSNCAVATSGDTFQRLEFNGVRYSHIVDSRTGVGLTNQALATVIARDGLTADSLATALSVIEPAAGMKLAEKYNAAARVISVAGSTRVLEQNRRFEKLKWLTSAPTDELGAWK